MSADTPNALPPLPHPTLLTVAGVYNADQMRDYALTATAALRARLEAAERLRADAERYRWWKVTHGWKALGRLFPAVRPYVDADEVFDDSVDAAMKEPPR